MQGDAGNGNGPWRTLARVERANLEPGDRVSLRCNGVWFESLTLRFKGTVTAPIVIGSYGECAGRRPEIRPGGMELFKADFKPTEFGWAASLGQVPGMVYTRDAVMPRARFPATRTLPLNWANGKIQVQLKTLPGAPDSLRGADWIVRTNDYTIEERRIYGVDPYGAVAFAKPFAMKPADGAGYYLEGQPWMLPVSGGWAYDPQSAMLILHKKPDASVYVNNQQFGVKLDQSAYVRLQGLAIRFVTGVGVEVADSSNIVLDSLDVSDVGAAYVLSEQADNLVVSGLHGQRSQRDGVIVKRGMGAQITDCLLEDVGVSANPRKSVAAIRVDDAPASLIARNRIYRTGYAAIMFGKDAIVEKNIIEKSCLKLADCGAIYTSGAQKNQGYYNARVEDNLISAVPGDLEGSTSRNTLTAGIYLDDESRGIYVRRNFVEKAQRGIFSKATASHVSDNVLFDNEFGLMLSRTGAIGSGKDATHILNNLVVSKNKQMPLLVSTEHSGAVAEVRHNRVRSEAGAHASQFWIGTTRQPAPPILDVGKIRQSLSFSNTSGARQTYTCPLAKAFCGNLRQADGAVVGWPLDLAPGQAVVLMVGGGA
ncbi:MAG: right-handed parallel beta-helix repeat-containing protein [Thiobacillus sp.]|nr:right-handed parallel beta-helix repeat-containing protein [Thiobacillus sp.]